MCSGTWAERKVSAGPPILAPPVLHMWLGTVTLPSGLSVASAAPGFAIPVGQAMGAETALRGTWPCSASRAGPPQTALIPSVTTVLFSRHRAPLCFSHTSTQADHGRHATGHFVCNTYICFFFPHTFAFNGRGEKREILVASVSKDRGQRCPQPGLPLPSSRATLVSGQAAGQRMLPVSESR